jgi:hypothetical protein
MDPPPDRPLASSEDLLTLLADKHRYVQVDDSDSEADSEAGDVMIATLHIPLFSPVRVRAVVQRGEGRPETPLSPLSLLSRRLARRLGGELPVAAPADRASLERLAWQREIATQTSATASAATLCSPAPSRQQLASPRASHYYTAPSSPLLATPRPPRVRGRGEEVLHQEDKPDEQKPHQGLLKEILEAELQLEENLEDEKQLQENIPMEQELQEEVQVQAEQEAAMRDRRLRKALEREERGLRLGEARRRAEPLPWGRLPAGGRALPLGRGELVEEVKKKPVIRDILFGCFKAMKL